MRKLKTLFTVLFLAVFGLGNVWATVIDVDLSASETYPSGFPTVAANSTNPLEVVFNGYAGKTFVFNSTNDTKPYFASSYLMFGKCKSTVPVSIDLPAISNEKLTKVELATTTAGSTNVFVTIRSGQTVLTGGESKQYANSTTLTWNLTNTQNNTSYRVYFLGNNTTGRNVQVKGLKLTYEGGSTETAV